MLPPRCVVEGCEAEPTRRLHLADHLTVTLVNQLGRTVDLHDVAVCVEHDGLLRYLGVTVPGRIRVAASTHWLEDPDVTEIEHPPWRVLEYGLPGMEHPGKVRRIVKETAET